jgi:hypothetical protein
MFLELALVLGAAVPARPYAEERALLDRRLEALHRVLPDGPQPTADQALVSELARSASLTDTDIQARAPLETGGTRGHVLVDVKARGRYADVERFFRQVALSPRLVDVESLTLTAAAGEQTTLTALLRLPYRPLHAPLPPAPEDIPRPAGMTRPQLGAYLHGQALSLAKSEAIAVLRRSRRNPRLFLSELAAVTRDRPVILSQATLGEEFVIRGMTTGESSMRDLEARLEQGFFRMTEVLVVHHGACYRFEARGQSPVVGPQAEIPLPTEDPFRVDEAACRVDRDSGPLNVLRAPRVKKGDPRGPLTLRLRGVDLADAFLALHQASGEAFIVDGELRGRVSLDLDRVTLAQAMAALAQAGVSISPGPIHFVTRGSTSAAARSESPGPVEGETVSPVSLSVKRASVSDLLAVFAEADPALLTWGPQPALGLGRLSVFAKNVPAAVLRAAVLAAASLRERRQDDRRLVGVPEGTTPPLMPLNARASPRRLVLPREDLAVHEFALAGVAGSESGWSAFVYGPGGSLHAFRAGDRIRDASVVEIDAANAILSTDEGLLRVPLP